MLLIFACCLASERSLLHPLEILESYIMHALAYDQQLAPALNAFLYDQTNGQMPLFDRTIPGNLSGNENENPLKLSGISFAEEIEFQNLLVDRFAEYWNNYVTSNYPKKNHSEWLVQIKRRFVSPQEVKLMISGCEDFLNSPIYGREILQHENDSLPAFRMALENLLTVKDTGFYVASATKGDFHLDTYALIESVTKAVKDPYGEDSLMIANTLSYVLDYVNREFGNVVHLGGALDYGVYDFDKMTGVRVPAIDRPISLYHVMRLISLQNTQHMSNGIISMMCGGMHTTSGVQNKRELGKILTVDTALTPTLFVLTQNSSFGDEFEEMPVRLLNGTLLGQRDEHYPRMGCRYPDPNASDREVFEQNWRDIFNSPIIVEFEFIDDNLEKFLVVPVKTKNYGKTVNQYFWELERDPRTRHFSDETWLRLVMEQMKVWGLLRLRPITPDIMQVLRELRGCDSQTPYNALFVQTIAQQTAQNECFLNGLYDHFAEIDFIPQKHKRNNFDDRLLLGKQMRETAMVALSGFHCSYMNNRWELIRVPYRGLMTPYVDDQWRLNENGPKLAYTAEILIKVAKQADLPLEAIETLEQKVNYHTSNDPLLVAKYSRDPLALGH
jgi:hypothetical protein